MKDENDNCLIFRTLPGNYKVPVEIVANDDDHGDNGQMHYSTTEESDPDQKFYITSTGNRLPNSVLQPGAYLLGFCGTSLDVENFLKGKCVLVSSGKIIHMSKF